MVCGALGYRSLSFCLIQDVFEARLSVSTAGIIEGRLELDLHLYLQKLLKEGKLIVAFQIPR